MASPDPRTAGLGIPQRVRHFVAIIGVGTAVSSHACSSANGALDPPPDNGGPTGSTCPEQSTLTYTTFANVFFATYCTRCHNSALPVEQRNGAPRELNYDSLEGVRAVDPERIDHVAAAGPDHLNSFMPPSAPRPSNDERAKLGEWLACGSPE